MPCASASLAVWSAAWLAGSVAADDVLDALTPWSDAHDVVAADTAAAAVTDLPTPDRAGTGLAALLVLARKRVGPLGPDARLVMPAPGDVRGLPGPDPLRIAAMDAGECAVLAGAGLAAVPSPVADGVLRWTVHLVDDVPPAAHPSLADAEHDLRGSVRDAADTLAAMDVARPRAGVREEIADALRRRPRPTWPAGTPGRPLRVLQHADEVEAIVVAAAGDDPGGAVSSSAALARTDALRPLATAVRAARVAAVAETVRALTAA
ncbi:hypothetical protein [Actinomycetospora straminea]|uniref:Golgi phosphoprotein 3 GPP34 n=1 Tax=Actinomycetospora straminea TaxID=663607 RepID=A0ABP9DUK8_9PSEU|nr:hypothetical protein [Actinomycetospora straminea]MDD7935220.1 hypothetical protein [Actinomycetospora straminea]